MYEYTSAMGMFFGHEERIFCVNLAKKSLPPELATSDVCGACHAAYMTAFEDLQVWKSGMLLMQEVYDISRTFPKEEQYGLTSQIRRASTSVLANLAEGCSRFTYPDKAAKFVICRGECNEVKAFAMMALSLGFIEKQETTKLFQLQEEVSRMLSGLIQTCRSNVVKKS